MKKIIIITSYIEYEFDLKSIIKKDDFVICTDGGMDIAMRQRIIPGLLMGDMDSISSELPRDIPVEKFNPEKDYTDLELALQKAVSLGAREVVILGGMGGRLDHTMAAIQLLSRYTGCFSSLVMKDGRNMCFVLYGKKNLLHTIEYQADSYLSLFSLSEECRGLTISNVKYPLEGHTLFRTFPLGVSNEFSERKDALLSFDEGTLLVVISGK